ncbi:uncharacterized protein PV09_07368 [Verruconis gallopava]|uniref:Transcription regulator Rua1 C-terminal domain-containing protein n=1 Tax=Verruconis gallopava TaxID=253628 RepID=A0A0D1YJP9_9PEZI|nr:uncharacterized protein PV09_07368 [Verruconis gallopava]KIW01077.1 hypothetical protein PV09_07368 [Verruconis gallopava]
MEFSSVPQHRPTNTFSQLDEREGNAALEMYSGSNLTPQTQTPQPTLSLPPQVSNGWFTSNMTAEARASQRHTMMFIDSRPPRSDMPQGRPLSMTAVSGYTKLGVQNPRGEYLAQPHMPLPVVQQPKMTQSVVVPNGWIQSKACHDLEFSNLEADMTEYGQGMFGVDDDNTVIDLRRFSTSGQDQARDMLVGSSRRMSESTNSMSSHGPFADLPHLDDSPPLDHPSHMEADWSGFDTSSISQLDPAASPRPPSLIRSASRSRASPVPNLRTSPYTLESTRNKRWSTGMYPGQPHPRPYQLNRYSSFYGSPLNPQHSISPLGPENVTPLPSQSYLFPSAPFGVTNNAMLYPTSDPFPEVPRPLPSQGLFRLLQSNADRSTGCYSHCADLSDPPDLYSSLNEKPSEPPEEDMNPSEPEMVPHEQELRFPGDLYTPKWVRGHGNKREGWCGLCKPGRWLVLKNSAFWYDKSFTHGVSAATGAAFQSPQETRRTEGNLDVWEGLCGSCGEWIALVSSKKKGTTWFRHAYKCHTHPKVKDGPKRRREIAVTTIRSSEPASNSEPTITVSCSTPPSSGVELSAKEPRLVKLEEGAETKQELNRLEVKIEDEATPVSTPQLTHTSMSTPQLATMHTPTSSYTPTAKEKKRFSVMFDTSMISQSFSSQLEAFAEHESESTPTMEEENNELSTEPQQQQPNTPTEPTYIFNHDGTFTENSSIGFSVSNNHDLKTDTDHLMSLDHSSTNDFFPQPSHFDFSAPPMQPLEYKITHPPEGNWI